VKKLKVGNLYYVDGGYFQAKYNAEQACIELWTYMGLAGYLIGRTGFAVGEDGVLWHRVFDFETEEQMLFESGGLTLDDLQEVEPF
jgi:hypothetical protein